MTKDKCGGCRGEGRHVRWCPWVVGAAASQLGEMSEQAETLGDRIGANNVLAANMAYQLAGELKRDACERASKYMQDNDTQH